MHINSSIPNLIGGVSQQPELLRLPSHMRSQVNAICSPSRGLQKRPATRHVAGTSIAGPGYYKVLDYGSRGIFYLQMQSGAFRIVDNAGNFVQLYNHAGQAIDSTGGWGPYQYLWAPDVETAMKVVKEADTTFIVNTTVPVQKLTGGGRISAYSALILIKAGNYGRTYTLGIPGWTPVAFQVPDGSDSTHAYHADTNNIAAQLAAKLVQQGCPLNVYGSLIYMANAPSGIYVDDGAGNSASAVIYKSVRSITELPSAKVPGGFDIKVEGGDATSAGDYHLYFDADSRVWRETRDPMAQYFAPDPNTLPHKLIPYGSGFQIAPITWATQMVGDPETNPGPSFYGKTINDLFFYQDRLGLLSGEGFDLSESGAYYNFYRTTVTDLLDSDPISGTVTSTTKVSHLRHGVTFGKRLFLFSDKGEFELQSDQALTPKTGSTQQVAEFECSSTVRPAGVGSTLYFPVDRGAYTAFYNFFLDGIDSNAQAVDVSAHVPEYIPKGVTQMVVSPVNNMLLALNRSEPTALYVYQFYVNGAERLQSAWHKWDFGPAVTIRCMDVVGTTLWMVIERYSNGSNGTYIEAIELSEQPGQPRLDRMVVIQPGVIQKLPDTTYSTFPSVYSATRTGTYWVLVIGDGTYVKAGAIYEANAFNPGTVLVNGVDLRGCTLVFGKEYEMRAALGRFTMREQSGQGSAGVSRGRTQVGRAWVNYAGAAAFTVEVVKNGNTTVYPCSTKALGTASAIIGAGSLRDGRFGFPILSRNTDAEVFLVNNTPQPSSFLSLDWEGYHVSRGQHV